MDSHQTYRQQPQRMIKMIVHNGLVNLQQIGRNDFFQTMRTESAERNCKAGPRGCPELKIIWLMTRDTFYIVCVFDVA
jgi:hypothetical protein